MKRTSIGGQAVMEGVMMKNQDQYAVAVRKPNKEIEVFVDQYESFTKKNKIFALPLIRGVVSFAESMIVGMKTLTYSASFFEEEEEKPSKFENWLQQKTNGKAEDILMGVTVCISILMAIGIFMVLPFFISSLLKRWIVSSMLLSLVEGVIRIAIFLAYIMLISQMEEIRRVFMYHGAEHKTINCFESGEELTPENVKKYSRLHKRCGTSFLLIVMIISILFFMWIQVDNIFLKVLCRILLVPVIAGVSYEFIRLAGKSNSKIICILSKPGLMLQNLTTKEPDLDMIEVAIHSVEAVLDWRAYQQAMRDGQLED